jgi:(1->4)-alpha-D-glucan 1-alpha-D-glucosylmutase
VDPAGEPALSSLVEQTAGAPQDWDVLVHSAKLEIVHNVLGSELERAVELARRTLTSKRDLRDATRGELRTALGHVLASYDGYRSYVREGSPLHELDRKAVATAIERARNAYVEGDARLWVALERALTLQPPYQDAADLALTVQQLSSAIAAKAVEDTAGYRYARLLALNEVGGTPGTFGISREEFHRALARAKPTSMLGSTTHDTKRGEDVRARLLILSELADEWSSVVTRWLALAAVHAAPELDRVTQYFFLQTLVGAYPLSEERALAYMQKAAREAKRETRWTAPNASYEAALERYVRGVLSDSDRMAEITAFVDRIAALGFIASLARTLIKLTAPGVPDVYQGSELWDLSLVDPDNRRPVDFGARRELLLRAPELSPEAALGELERGTPKLWLIARTLELRRRSPELFEGAYTALATHGPGDDAVLAYARGGRLVTVVPRWPGRAQLDPSVQVRLPEGRFRDVLTGELVQASTGGASVRALWSRFPVALLARQL